MVSRMTCTDLLLPHTCRINVQSPTLKISLLYQNVYMFNISFINLFPFLVSFNLLLLHPNTSTSHSLSPFPMKCSEYQAVERF
jgi:hypothetical protein